MNKTLDMLLHVGIAVLFLFETYRIIMNVPPEGDVENAIRWFMRGYAAVVIVGWIGDFFDWLGIWEKKHE